jgi:hypothetical protein
LTVPRPSSGYGTIHGPMAAMITKTATSASPAIEEALRAYARA